MENTEKSRLLSEGTMDVVRSYKASIDTFNDYYSVIFIFLAIKWIYSGLSFDSKVLFFCSIGFVFFLNTISSNIYEKTAKEISPLLRIFSKLAYLMDFTALYILIFKGGDKILQLFQDFDFVVLIYTFIIIFLTIKFYAGRIRTNASIKKSKKMLEKVLAN